MIDYTKLEKLLEPSSMADFDMYTKEDLIEFGVLVVKKASKWIENTDSDSDIGQEDAQALLEHFGVEE